MWNLDTQNGIVKNRRCWIEYVGNKLVIVKFEDGSTYPLSRMEFHSHYGGLNFTRTQIPLKYAFAVTVHKSQGITLSKIVVDLRNDLWEHGQLYVALSRIRDPRNLCVLLPIETDYSISPVVDRITVNEVRRIESNQSHYIDAHLVKYIKKYPKLAIPQITNTFISQNVIIEKSTSSDEDNYYSNDDRNNDTQLDIQSNNGNNDIQLDIQSNNDTELLVSDTNHEINQDSQINGIQFTLGFPNLNSICFFNSILYLLFHINPIREHILNNDFQYGLDGIKKHFYILNYYLNKYGSHSDFIHQTYSNNLPLLFGYDLNIQRDLGEVFLDLVNNYLMTDNTLNEIINDIFSISTTTIFITLDDEEVEAKPSTHFTLDVLVKQSDDLENAICNYFELTDLDFSQPEKIISQENKKKYKQKHELLLNLPPILIFHLQRYDFIEDRLIKLCDDFPFNNQFDLSTLLANVNGSASQLPPTNYLIKGIIVHSGNSPNSGHYYSFYLHNDQWFIFNDNLISKVDIEFVHSHSFGGSKETAYYLIYQREYKNLFFNHNAFSFL